MSLKIRQHTGSSHLCTSCIIYAAFRFYFVISGQHAVSLCHICGPRLCYARPTNLHRLFFLHSWLFNTMLASTSPDVPWLIIACQLWLIGHTIDVLNNANYNALVLFSSDCLSGNPYACQNDPFTHWETVPNPLWQERPGEKMSFIISQNANVTNAFPLPSHLLITFTTSETLCDVPTQSKFQIHQ